MPSPMLAALNDLISDGATIAGTVLLSVVLIYTVKSLAKAWAFSLRR